MKKWMCVLLSLLLLLGCAACGKDPTPDNPGGDTPGGDQPQERPAGTKIVIYNGGSSEFSVAKGSDEAAVIEAIEQKYWEDTGTSLDFEVSYLGSSMKSKLASTLSSGEQLDIVVSHTRGGSGIDEYVLANDCYYDLSDLLYDFGSNILDHLTPRALSAVTTYEDQVIGIPSVISPYKFGILVRKDYMEAVGYTDDPLRAGPDRKLVDSVSAFADMCVAMKVYIAEKVGSCSHVISGAIWDIEKVMLGAYAQAGYYTYAELKNADGSVQSLVPGFITDEYADMMALEYDWVKEKGIVSANANSMMLEVFESEFIAGKTGVFLCDPTVQHLITVSRKVKSNDASAEFAVLGALPKDAKSTRKGFLRNSEATFLASIMKTSKNAQAIVKFYNWMYAKPENYELCRYGIEGKHWTRNADGTYSYTKEEYMAAPPYSGAIALVENQSISNLSYSGYTEEERAWIATAARPENYIDNDTVDYLLPYSSDLDKKYKAAANPLFSGLANPCWYGTQDPLSMYDDKQTQFEYYQAFFKEKAASYLTTTTQYYKLMKG